MRQHKRPYRYALNKRERPRDAKLFYGITENKKSANEHLTQTAQRKNLKLPMFNDILILDLFYRSHLTNQLKIGGNIYMGNFCTQCGRPL